MNRTTSLPTLAAALAFSAASLAPAFAFAQTPDAAATGCGTGWRPPCSGRRRADGRSRSSRHPRRRPRGSRHT